MERMNSTIKTELKKGVNSTNSNWDKALPLVLMKI